MFAVVVFDDDQTPSEIPSNWLFDDIDGSKTWWPPVGTKNLSSLISKRIEPNPSTWQMLKVNVEKFCNTLEKARKIAVNSQYTSTDELELGKGRRKRVPAAKTIISNTSSSSSEDNESTKDAPLRILKHNSTKTIIKSSCQPVPVFPSQKSMILHDTSSTLNDTGNEVPEPQRLQYKIAPNQPNPQPVPNVSSAKTIEDSNATCAAKSSLLLKKNLDLATKRKTQDFVRIIHQENTSDESQDSAQIFKSHSSLSKISDSFVEGKLTVIESKLDALIRKVASVSVNLVDLTKQINFFAHGPKVSGPTEQVRKILPLKSIEEIKDFEKQLKTIHSTLSNEYKTFISKVGGHSARQNIQRILERVFTNEVAMKCSWKGLRNNYGVGDLMLIKIVKDNLLNVHSSLKEKDIDDTGSEWFRFARQRFHRNNKKLEPIQDSHT